jgi:hypothetical protein
MVPFLDIIGIRQRLGKPTVTDPCDHGIICEFDGISHLQLPAVSGEDQRNLGVLGVIYFCDFYGMTLRHNVGSVWIGIP